jgi:hypothetical protein
MNYYNFIVGLEGNKISVAKLQSTDGTAEGTELLDADGLSTHPSIKYFISKEGIELDPPSNKTPFSYLYNFTGTEGCSLVQNTFTAASHDLTFLPDNIKSLYEPQVTSNKIVFITPTNSTVTLTDRPGRFIDYNNPDGGSVGEDYDFDVVDVPCEQYYETSRCSYKVKVNLFKSSCNDFNLCFFVTKSIWNQYVCGSPSPNIECKKIDLESFKLEDDTVEIIQQKRQSREVSQSYKSKTECYETLDFCFRMNSQGSVTGNMEIKGRVSAPSGSSVVEGPGLGVTLIEEALKFAADAAIPSPHLIANRLINTATAANLGAGLTTGEQSGNITKAAGSVINLVKDPVNTVLSYAFDLLNSQLSDTFQDYLNIVSDEINKIISDCKKTSKDSSECASCVNSKIKEQFNNKNSPMRKNINKIITASKIQTCC